MNDATGKLSAPYCQFWRELDDTETVRRLHADVGYKDCWKVSLATSATRDREDKRCFHGQAPRGRAQTVAGYNAKHRRCDAEQPTPGMCVAKLGHADGIVEILASSGSIVTMNSLRKSRRPARSDFANAVGQSLGLGQRRLRKLLRQLIFADNG